uniref:Uncharacterized protein n=1 Tax=Anguilla anguilla TaxID=7936 RepID=A0A0E9PGJ0_ANGAN
MAGQQPWKSNVQTNIYLNFFFFFYKRLPVIQMNG